MDDGHFVASGSTSRRNVSSSANSRRALQLKLKNQLQTARRISNEHPRNNVDDDVAFDDDDEFDEEVEEKAPKKRVTSIHFSSQKHGLQYASPRFLLTMSVFQRGAPRVANRGLRD